MRHFISTLTKKKNLIGAEIGVLRARHAEEMLEGLDIKKLYLVDPYSSSKDVYKYALDVMKPYEDKVNWLILPSLEAVKHVDDNSLDFVYVDGLHTYEGCFNDINVWHRKVKKGGWIAGHDWTLDDVVRAVKDFTDQVEHSDLNTDLPDGDWYFKKI